MISGDKGIKSDYHWFNRINFFKKISNEKFMTASISDSSIRTVLFDGKYLTITGNDFSYKDSRTDTIRAECEKF